MTHRLTQAEAEQLHRDAEVFQNAPPPAFHGSQQFSHSPIDSHTHNLVSEAALLPPLYHIQRTPALFTSSNHTSFPAGNYSTIGYPDRSRDLSNGHEQYGTEWKGWSDKEDDASEEPVKSKRVAHNKGKAHACANCARRRVRCTRVLSSGPNDACDQCKSSKVECRAQGAVPQIEQEETAPPQHQRRRRQSSAHHEVGSENEDKMDFQWHNATNDHAAAGFTGLDNIRNRNWNACRACNHRKQRCIKVESDPDGPCAWCREIEEPCIPTKTNSAATFAVAPQPAVQRSLGTSHPHFPTARRNGQLARVFA